MGVGGRGWEGGGGGERVEKLTDRGGQIALL